MTDEMQAKLALVEQEALRLAIECETGTAPPLSVGGTVLNGKPCCVFGHLLFRAGYRPHTPDRRFNDYELSRFLFGVNSRDELLAQAPDVASVANAVGVANDTRHADVPKALRRFAAAVADWRARLTPSPTP